MEDELKLRAKSMSTQIKVKTTSLGLIQRLNNIFLDQSSRLSFLLILRSSAHASDLLFLLLLSVSPHSRTCVVHFNFLASIHLCHACSDETKHARLIAKKKHMHVRVEHARRTHYGVRGVCLSNKALREKRDSSVQRANNACH